MKNHDTRVYSIADFLEWHRNSLLRLDPDFQRRAVWSEKAKSYLIDTIVRGKILPKILMTQSLENARTVRVVVDGQQRLRAIIGFAEEDFTLSRVHNPELAGVPFSQLPQDVQDDFLQYELGVDLLYDMSYEEMLDVFARINSYTVTLLPQERRNAKYLGYFKQAAFSLGHQYAEYFIQGGVLTKAKVSRMAEAQLASDLLVALLDGVQTNKNLEQFYRQYDDYEGELPKAVERFGEIMSYVGSIYPVADLRPTNWARVHLFYTLFTSIGHLQYGLGRLDPALSKRFQPSDLGRLRVRLDEVSAAYDDAAEGSADGDKLTGYGQFVEWSRRGTTDSAARVGRANFVCARLIEVI